MKVLLINHFPLEGSGSGTYTKNIALHLQKRGHEVCVVFPENQPFSLLPGICGIGEPMVFGLPLVLNPVFAIPFILNSGIAAAIGLFAIKIGFISCSIVDAPFGLPLFINATISYGWHGAIVQLVILIVGTLTYIPFVLMSNRMAEKEAQKEQ